MPDVKSSTTATGGRASNGTMITKFHVSVKTQGAAAASDLLGDFFALAVMRWMNAVFPFV